MKKKAPSASSPFAALKELKDKLAAEEATKKPGQAPAPAPLKPKKAPKLSSEEARAADAKASEEDDLAFHRMVSGVTRLGEAPGRVSPVRAPRVERPIRDRAAEEAEVVHEHLRALVEGGTRFETSDDGKHVEGRRVDVPPDWLRRLRRGQLPIDARIDLHGLRAGDARAKLTSFLEAQRARGERCVLVIHGKGEHSPEGTGVLRGEVGAWLSQGSASPHVAAFATAQPHDGGEGAIYVLLRR